MSQSQNSEHTEQQEAQKNNHFLSLLRRMVSSLRLLLVLFFVVLVLRTFIIQAYEIPTSSMVSTLVPGDFIIVNKAVFGATSPPVVPFTNIAIPTITAPVFGEPERGDVIVFHFPGNDEELVPSRDVSYIKRVIGLPGDTVRIINEKVFVNGERLADPPDYPRLGTRMPDAYIDKDIFPSGYPWNRRNYGPVVIPYKGMRVQLTVKNAAMWKTLINRELGYDAFSIRNGRVHIGGIPRDTYTVQNQYYFVLGDNREDSLDSRYWGFVPRDHVIGEALMVYWSFDRDSGNFWEARRPERIFKIIE